MLESLGGLWSLLMMGSHLDIQMGFLRNIWHTELLVPLNPLFEQMELPAGLLEYLICRNKSNMEQWSFFFSLGSCIVNCAPGNCGLSTAADITSNEQSETTVFNADQMLPVMVCSRVSRSLSQVSSHMYRSLSSFIRIGLFLNPRIEACRLQLHVWHHNPLSCINCGKPLNLNSACWTKQAWVWTV